MNKHRWLIALFVILAAVYLWQIQVIPTDQATLARYRISASIAQLLRLSIAAPYIVVWFVALYGYLRLARYAWLLRASPEHVAWKNIARGLLVIVLYLPISTILSNWSSSNSHVHPESTATTTIIYNYIILTILMISAYFLVTGARRLTALNSTSNSRWSFEPIYTLGMITLSAMFIYINLSNPARQFPVGTSREAAYYLPDWLLVVSVLVPYLLVWIAGIKTVEYIHVFSKNVRGTIYRHSLRFLAGGIATIIASLIVLRFLIAMTTSLSTSGLKVVLLLVYGLIALMAVGYILVAFGANKLAKIEEA